MTWPMNGSTARLLGGGRLVVREGGHRGGRSRASARYRIRLRLLPATGAAARKDLGEADERSTHQTPGEDTGPLLRRRLELRASLHGSDATRRMNPMRAQSHVEPHGGPVQMRRAWTR